MMAWPELFQHSFQYSFQYAPMFYLAAAVAVLLTGISKGGFGIGSGGFAVPIMSIYIAPVEAAGIMLPLLCAMDLFGAHAYRRTWSRHHLGVLLPGALIGIALGALAFGLLPVNVLRLLVGLIAVIFVLNKWLRLSERLAWRLSVNDRVPGRAAGLFWGLLHPTPAFAFQIKVFFLLCVIVAGLFGAATVSRRILLVQAAPAVIALILLWLS
jgi:uncharacterized membrane protein YfcA